MYIYITLALLISFSCLIARRPQTVNFVFVTSFIAISIFLAIRFKFGPDYSSYLRIFNDLHKYGLNKYLSINVRTELFFILYMKVFPYYTAFIAFQSLLWVYVLYYFFNKYGSSKYYWFLFLFLFFDANCILNNSVALRTSLCGIIFIIAFSFLLEGKKWAYILLIIFASLFHISSIVLVLLILFKGSYKSFITKNLTMWIFLLVGLMSIIIGKDVLLKNVSQVIISQITEFDRYKVYAEQGTRQISGIMGYIKSLGYTSFSLYISWLFYKNYHKETNRQYRIIFEISVLYLFILIAFGSGNMSRYLMILAPVFIIGLIRVFRYISNSQVFYAISIVLFMSIYSLYNYLSKDYSISFLTYKTIFEAPFIP
jgi:hypothetical protein